MVDEDEFEDSGMDDDEPGDGGAASQVLGVLFWVAVLAGLAWIGLSAYVQIRIQVEGETVFDSVEAADAFRWFQVASGLSATLFLVSVGLYVITWLRRD
jgi:hypothetical protein